MRDAQERLRPVASGTHGVARTFEEHLEERGQVGLVLYHQHLAAGPRARPFTWLKPADLPGATHLAPGQESHFLIAIVYRHFVPPGPLPAWR